MRNFSSQLIAFFFFFFFFISHLLGAWLRRRNLAMNNITYTICFVRTGYVIIIRAMRCWAFFYSTTAIPDSTPLFQDSSA